MATRFYFPRSGTAGISPNVDAGWEITAVTRRPLVYKGRLSLIEALANETAVTVPITTTQDIVGFQFVSEPLRAQIISGTFGLVIRTFENANTNNVTLAVVVRAISQDLAIRGTLVSNFNVDASEFNLTASAATRIANAVAVTQTTVQDGDRIVVEVGGHAAAPSAAGSYTMRFGTNAASDFALTSGLTTDLNPWCEFSANIFADLPNNFKHIRAETGMSVAEKIR